MLVSYGVAQARRMLREADTNGDGMVSKGEFETLLQASSVPDSLDAYDPRWQQPDFVPQIASM